MAKDEHDLLGFPVAVDVGRVPGANADLVGILEQWERFFLVQDPALPIWCPIGHCSTVQLSIPACSRLRTAHRMTLEIFKPLDPRLVYRFFPWMAAMTLEVYQLLEDAYGKANAERILQCFENRVNGEEGEMTLYRLQRQRTLHSSWPLLQYTDEAIPKLSWTMRRYGPWKPGGNGAGSPERASASHGCFGRCQG